MQNATFSTLIATQINARVTQVVRGGVIAEVKGVPNTAIAMAWILRHPAKIQPIAGTTNPKRLKDICKASDVELTRQEWYEIYRAAGNELP
jgi:predicted oxidoreductase